jgi:hypothetical protein
VWPCRVNVWPAVRRGESLVAVPLRRIGLLGVEADLGDRLALVRGAAAGVLVVAGICVDVEVGVALALLLHLHRLARLVDIEVAEGDAAGPDLLAEAERMDVLALVDLAAGRHEPQRGFAGDRRVAAGVVGQHEGVPVLVVLEEVEDPVLLEQARQERQVVLLVLHTVIARGVCVDQVEAKAGRGQSGVGEHLLDDVRGGHLLEDAAVSPVLQAPQPRHDPGLVELEVAGVADIFERRADARHEARGLEPGDLQGHVRIDHARQVHLGSGQFDVDLVEPREPLAGGESDHPEVLVPRVGQGEQRLVAQRRLQLRQCAHRYPPTEPYILSAGHCQRLSGADRGHL